MEIKCFRYRGFGHIIHNCRNMGKKILLPILSNKFEVLKSRVMQKGEESKNEVGKDKKEEIVEKSNCYDLRLGSDYNLGKDLSKSGE